jgi:hypothetical protein
MTKKLYTLRTGAWDWTAPKNIFILAGGAGTMNPVPFVVERIDAYWEAVKGDQLRDTLYFNWRVRDDFPDSPYLVTPPEQANVLRAQGLSPTFAECDARYASADYGIPIPEDGPFCWSPSPGDSVHTFDLTQIGGLIIDPAASDGGACLHLAFKHDAEYYGQSYRFVITISEDT